MPAKNSANDQANQSFPQPSVLNTLRINRLDKNSLTFKTLEKFYRSKSALPRYQLEDLTQERGPKSGITEGYLASDSTDNHVYMVKTGSAKDRERVLFLNEYLCAGAYQRVLYNRAPDVELVEDSAEKHALEFKHSEDFFSDPEKTKLYLRSKFLNNFEPISQLEYQAYKTNDFRAIKNIKGFAKVLAACLWLGEIDGHADNLGIIKHEVETFNGSYEVERIAVKIDHGMSGHFNRDEKEIRVELSSLFSQGKKENWQKPGPRPGTYTLIDCKVSELIYALEQITKISDSEIENLIGSRALKLKAYFLASTHKKSLTKKDVEEYLRCIETQSTVLIKGLIHHKNLIQNDLLRSLKVINIIADGAAQVSHTDKRGVMLIDQPIDELIDKALSISINPSELEFLKETTQHFYQKTLELYKINPEQICKLSALEDSKNWGALSEFERTPYYEKIKQVQNLEKIEQLILLKIQSLQNNSLEDYSAYKAQIEQAKQQLEKEQMAWILKNRKEQFIPPLPLWQPPSRNNALDPLPQSTGLVKAQVAQSSILGILSSYRR